MTKLLAVILYTTLTALCFAQNTPTLRKVGPADPRLTGNLEGFQPIDPAWPEIKTILPDGTQTSITVLIAKGKPYRVSIQKSSADKKAMSALAAALRKWRFAMPHDGSSPVSFTVTWKAVAGKLVAQDISVGIVPVGTEPTA